jgi:dimethylargininase
MIAITRGVSAGIAACELTHLERRPIDFERAQAQHGAYEQALARAGCRVESLPALDDLPDSVFVEDVAIVLDEIAIVTRPGARSRRAEADHIAPLLAKYRRVSFIQEPGTLDGGDVLRLGRRLYVGRSGRSDDNGIEQLRAVAWPYGYTVTAVPVSGCLHLKSAITEVSPGVVLVNPAWVGPAIFGHATVMEVDPAEPYGANGLLVGSRLIYPESFPRTRRRLEAAGIVIEPVDVSELQKAEGAVTCCSLVFTDMRNSA